MNKFFYLYFLHFLNDGFESSFLLLLPFIAKEVHITFAQVGFLGAIESSVEILLSLPASYFALRYGAFRTLVVALSIYALGFFLTGIAPSITFLFVTFVITGIGFGIFNSIGLSLAARWADQSSRGKQMGTYSSSGDLGKTGISTLLPLLITTIGWRLAAISYSIVGFIVFIIFQKLSRNIHKVEITTKKVKSISLLAIVQNRRFLFANAVNLFDSLASAALFIFFPFLLVQKGIPLVAIGFFTFTFFLGVFAGKLTLGRLSDIWENTYVLIVSEILMGVCIFVLAQAHQYYTIILISFFLGIFSKGTTPIIKTMISDSIAHHKNFEKSFGFNVIIASIAATLSPIMWGYISNQFGIKMAFNISAVVTMITIIPTIGYMLSPKPK